MTSESNHMSTLVAVEQYISIYGPFILTTLGIVGNILSILIFLSPRYRRQSSHFYLLSLALSDLCFLIINLLEDTFRNHNQLYQSHLNFLDRSSSTICILVQYARNVTRSLSSWIVISFTIERLLVVFHPLKRAIICRRKIARLVVLTLFLLILLSNLNVPFHYGVINSTNPLENDTICDILPEYRPIYMTFAITTMITVYLLPMCIIGFVNTLICCKLWRKSLLMEKDESVQKIKDKPTSFSSRNLSYFAEFLSCFHLSRRSSASSTVVVNQSPRDRSTSFSHFQAIGPLLNTGIHLPQVSDIVCRQYQQVNGSLVHDDHRLRMSTRSLSSVSANFPMQPKQSVCSIRTYIQSRTHRVTATLLLVSCSFLLLNTPYCVAWIANYVHGFRNVTLKSIKEITELFMLTNFCINFLLYCVSGKVFRSELICLLRCQWKELYGRNEADRKNRRKSHPKIEIQLNETKLKPRSFSLYPNNQQKRPLFTIYTNRIPNSR